MKEEKEKHHKDSEEDEVNFQNSINRS
jgi:hypothetical protein